MRTVKQRIDGDECSITLHERGDRLAGLADLLSRTPVVAVDCESSGTDVRAPGWVLRTVQFGGDRTAFVLPVATHADAIHTALKHARGLTAHNAGHDIAALEVGLGADPASLHGKMLDTLTVSRLLDPMGYSVRQDGKLLAKHDLKSRTRQLVDPGYDDDKQLKAEFRRTKTTWGTIPLDNEEYIRYAGTDCLIGHRLLSALWRPSPRFLALLERERRISWCCYQMERRGMRIDHAHTRAVARGLLEEAREALETARDSGWPVDDVATDADKDRAANWLRGKGVRVGKTATGKPKFDKPSILASVAGSPIEHTVTTFFAAKANKRFVKDYLEKLLKLDRYHPGINTLAAITGRMSVSGTFPVQQAPTEGPVRGCLAADDGYLIAAADLDRIEFAVAAGLSRDPALIEACTMGTDIHLRTARSLYGDAYDPDSDGGHARTIAKRAGFGRLYGAGAATVARQCGCAVDTAASMLRAFDKAYPTVRRFSKRLGDQSWVRLASGRVVPGDPQRSYGNVNYAVQGAARDVFCDGLLRAWEAGLGDYLLLPVHDELVAQFPAADAESGLKELVECMSGDFYGVPIRASGKVLGHRWGKA